MTANITWRKNMTIVDDLVKAKKRKNELVIKTLPEILQVMRRWVGSYDMNTGHIEIGSLERETASTLWHEQLHKLLWEKESLESGIMWDNIASAIEDWIGLNPATIPYALTLPTKRAKPDKNYADKWIKGTKPVSEPTETFGLGITTYKSGKIDNYKLAAKEISKTIKKELIETLDVKLLEDRAAIGIYKGGVEPSYAPIMQGKITKALKDKIKNFKDKYHQESVILYKFGGIKNIGIEISYIPESKVKELQDRISKVTSEKLGGFMTHTFEENRFTIINVPEFDQLTKSQFTVFIPKIRKEVRNMGGNMRSFAVDVEVI